jgi:hypothetical protein
LANAPRSLNSWITDWVSVELKASSNYRANAYVV